MTQMTQIKNLAMDVLRVVPGASLQPKVLENLSSQHAQINFYMLAEARHSWI
jgi:hypothetical protein